MNTSITSAILFIAASFTTCVAKSPELTPTSFQETIVGKNTFAKFYAPVSSVSAWLPFSTGRAISYYRFIIFFLLLSFIISICNMFSFSHHRLFVFYYLHTTSFPTTRYLYNYLHSGVDIVRVSHLVSVLLQKRNLFHVLWLIYIWISYFTHILRYVGNHLYIICMAIPTIVLDKRN